MIEEPVVVLDVAESVHHTHVMPGANAICLSLFETGAREQNPTPPPPTSTRKVHTHQGLLGASLALRSQRAKHCDKTSFAESLTVKKMPAWWLQGRQHVQNKVPAEKEVVSLGGCMSENISNTCILMSGVRFS